MAERYSTRIRAYCTAQGIEVPVGFHRHPANRYAVVQLDATPPRLVARTWSKQEDLRYYLEHLPPGTPVRVLDFQEHAELLVAPDGHLRRGGSVAT